MCAGHWFRFLFSIAAACAQPTGSGVIGGMVVDDLSGDPVRKAIVTLTWHGAPRSWATLSTTGDGRFRFEGLPAGNYDLRAQKQGIGSATYGADRVGELGALIPLAGGQTRDDLKLHFIHASSISGSVVDADGDPVVQANVTLFRQSRELGEPVLVRVNSGASNDRGEFQLHNVAPGRYYISAAAQEFLGMQRAAGVPALVPAFLGGAADWKESSPLVIHSGESVRGVDFRLIALPAVRLHGHVSGLPPRDPPPQNAGIAPLKQIYPPGSVQVFVRSLDRFDPGGMGVGANGPDAEFDGMNLPPGRYRLEATTRAGNRTYAASQIVDLQPGGGDVDLALAPAVDLKGHLRVEGGTAAQASGVQISFTRPGERSRNLSAHAEGNGSFTLPQIPPGEWALLLNAMPRGSYLKSVRLGDQDVRFKRIGIASGSDAALNIVISMNTAKIHGEVDAPEGTAARAAILLAPTGTFHDLERFYYGIAAGDDGKFTMAGIAPGKYKMFALEKLPVAAFRNPEAADALDQLIEGGAPEIELAENASLQVHPKLIPFERARQVLP